MDVFPLLLPFLFAVPGAAALPPTDVYVDGDVFGFDRVVGEGRLAASGEIATMHYVLSQDGGKDLADSTKRGLPFSVLMDGTLGISPIVDAVDGMRLGGTRTVFVPSSKFGDAEGALLPKDSTLVLRLTLVALRSPKVPKVDSNYAGRTQGAVAIPRALDRHGPARP